MPLRGGRWKARGCDDRLAQQFLVGLAGLLVLIEADFLEVDLILHLQVALGGADPDGAGRRGQRFQQALEQLPVEGAGGDIRLA